MAKKQITLGIFIILLLNITFAYAENCNVREYYPERYYLDGKFLQKWVEFNNGGKVYFMNPLSQEYVQPWLVRYDIRRKEADKIIVNRLETDLKNRKSRIICELAYKSESDIYNSDKLIYINSEGTDYVDIKNGTVSSFIYNMYMDNYAPWHHW